jgi:uncharacterized membrane protein
MKKLVPSRIAEIIFALVIAAFGSNHFLKTDGMTGMVPSFMPGSPSIWVYVSGAALVLSALAIIFGIQKRMAGYLLAAVLLLFAFGKHLPDYLSPEEEGLKQLSIAMFLKDLALAMGAVLIGNNTRDK